MVVIRHGGGGPELVVEGFLQLLGDEGRSAERAGLLLVVQPPVEAAAVEDVTAVLEPGDLVPALELGEADRAAARALPRRQAQLVEPDDGEDLADEHGGDGLERRRGLPRDEEVVVRPGNVLLHEVAEAEEAEEGDDEAAEEGEKGEGADEELGEEELRVGGREAHLEGSGGGEGDEEG